MKTTNATCLEAIAAVQTVFMRTHDVAQTGLQFLESVVALTQSRCGLLSLVSGKTPAQWHSYDLFQDRLLTYMPGSSADLNLTDSMQYHHIQDMCAIAVDKQEIVVHHTNLFPTDDLPDTILPLHTLCIIPLFFQHGLLGICICCNRKNEYIKDRLMALQPLVEAFTIIRSSMATSGPVAEINPVTPYPWEHMVNVTNPLIDDNLPITLGREIHLSPVQKNTWQEKINDWKEACRVIISNLEMITDLFETQQLFAPDPELATCFLENSVRLKALSAVYELQVVSGKEGQVPLHQLLHKWIPDFTAKLNLHKPQIYLEESGPEIPLSVKQAIASILLINEILLLLRATAGRESHTIVVSASRERNTLQVNISSDTKGAGGIISSKMRFALIRTWADLLHAYETVQVRPALCFDYRFNILNA